MIELSQPALALVSLSTMRVSIQPWKNWDPKHPDLYAEVEQTLCRPSRQLPAGRVDVRVSVETEAVLTHLVHQEVRLQVQNSTAQIIFLGPEVSREESWCWCRGM